MKITRTPARWLWEARLIRYLKGLRGKKILEVGSATNSYVSLCEDSNTFVRVDIKKSDLVDRVEDVTSLSFESESFDLILLSNVLEHVYDYQKAIDECHRVLRRNGELVLIVPFLYPLHDRPADYWRFTEFALQKILHAFTSPNIESIGPRRLPFHYYCRAVK